MKISYTILFMLIAFASCKSKGGAEEEETSPADVITPVTVTSPSTDPMVEYLELNATSTYLLKGYVKASANGYLTTVNIKPGAIVHAGQTVFVLKTKEAQ